MSHPSNFITSIIDEDNRTGKHHGRVQTRFPPEPNGYLHIGHAKSICLNFGLAAAFQGKCNLRFDDTNPAKEDVEYVDSIQRDVRWLGFDWEDRLFHASDYFERMYQLAVELIKKGKAYVCSLNEEQIRQYRGTVKEPGRPSPYRDRPIEESLKLLDEMRRGLHPEGAHVLRANIDMAAANMKMRDPLLYRIRHVNHDRTGDQWRIYPMYDYAHCLSDSFEGVTHSICTLEFENNRELYDWIIQATEVPCVPQQIEFARLNLNYTVMSKRKLLQLVQEKLVNGWDDPRMPTLSGMRRRGYTAEAIRDFCERIGVAKANSVVDLSQLEFSVRDNLNQFAPRVMAVLDPLKVVIENLPEDTQETLTGSLFPHDIPLEGMRTIPFGREIYIERDDFHQDPPKGYHRLAPDREVRLRHAYVIKCNRVVRDADGHITELRCTLDPDTLGKAPEGRKVKGTIHWVPAAGAQDVEVRLYERLFRDPNPEASGDFKENLNPDSLQIITAKAEPFLAQAKAGDHFQFERRGYFFVDPVDSKAGAPIFNRTVTLRDSWAKQDEKPAAPAKAKPAAKPSPAPPAPVKRLDKDQHQTAQFNRYTGDWDLSEEDADLIVENPQIAAFFEAAVIAHHNPKQIANWVNNELARELKNRQLGELPFQGAALGQLVALIDQGAVSTKIAKDVFAAMLAGEGDPAAIVEAKGLRQVSDTAELETLIDGVLAAHPDEVARFKAGEKKLKGFFVGRIMQASGGKANPKLVNQILAARF